MKRNVVWIQDGEPKTGLDYLLEIKEKADKSDEIFKAHETLMVKLCEILKLDYLEVTGEDVIQKVKELQAIRDTLEFDPFRHKMVMRK